MNFLRQAFNVTRILATEGEKGMTKYDPLIFKTVNPLEGNCYFYPAHLHLIRCIENLLLFSTIDVQ